MVLCYILRKTGTLKIKKVKDKLDSFTFEQGKYFILKDRMFLLKKLIGYRPTLFYKEGISEPLKLENIVKQKIKVVNEETGEETYIEDETVLINAKNIHDLTSSEMLSVLSSQNLSKVDKLLIGLIALSIIINIAGMF